MAKTSVRKHQHLIIRGSVLYPPNNPAMIESWLKELVGKIKMNILMGPWATYSDMVGNRGLTGVVVIETSHIAVHVWDEVDPGLIELDIFSCKEFVVDDVIQHMKQFGLVGINFRTIDRTDGLKDEKLFVVYETRNKINDKIYIGVHGGFTASDEYFGSGKALKAAIKKYGKENFEKSIIKIFNTAEEAYAFEKELVDSEKTRKRQSESGSGRVSHRKGKSLPEEQKQKIRASMHKRFEEGYVVHNSPKRKIAA